MSLLSLPSSQIDCLGHSLERRKRHFVPSDSVGSWVTRLHVIRQRGIKANVGGGERVGPNLLSAPFFRFSLSSVFSFGGLPCQFWEGGVLFLKDGTHGKGTILLFKRMIFFHDLTVILFYIFF